VPTPRVKVTLAVVPTCVDVVPFVQRYAVMTPSGSDDAVPSRVKAALPPLAAGTVRLDGIRDERVHLIGVDWRQSWLSS
jgi:hypothetical protein